MIVGMVLFAVFMWVIHKGDRQNKEMQDRYLQEKRNREFKKRLRHRVSDHFKARSLEDRR